jgi:hypothetical protein
MASFMAHPYTYIHTSYKDCDFNRTVTSVFINVVTTNMFKERIYKTSVNRDPNVSLHCRQQ